MTEQRQETSHLATLLRRHQDEIATVWAEVVHKRSSARYSQRPLHELHDSALRGIAAIVECLATGSWQAVELYLVGVSEMRLRLGFGISEVIEALLLFREAVLPVIRRTCPAGGSQPGCVT